MFDTMIHGLLVLAVYVFLPIALFSMAVGLMSRGRVDELAYLRGIWDGMAGVFKFILGICEAVSDIIWEKVKARKQAGEPRTYATAGEKALQKAFKVSVQYALAIGFVLTGLFMLGKLAGERQSVHCPPDAPVYCPDPRIN